MSTKVIVEVELEIKDFGVLSDALGKDKKVYLSKSKGNVEGKILNPDVLRDKGFITEYGSYKGTINMVMVPKAKEPEIILNVVDGPSWLDRYDPALAKQILSLQASGKTSQQINKALAAANLPKISASEFKQLGKKETVVDLESLL